MTKRTAVVQVTVTNDDRLAGLAQGTVLVMPPRDSNEDAPGSTDIS